MLIEILKSKHFSSQNSTHKIFISDKLMENKMTVNVDCMLGKKKIQRNPGFWSFLGLNINNRNSALCIYVEKL